MHILIIASERFQTYDSPLGGIFQLDQYNALKSNGLKVGIIAPAPLTLNGIYKKIRKRKNGCNKKYANSINIIRTNFVFPLPARYFSALYSICFVLIGLLQYYKYLKKNGLPSIIHCHNIWVAGFLGYWIKKVYKVKNLVLTEHDSSILENSYFERFSIISYNKILEEFNEILTVSSFLKKLIQKKCEHKQIKVIHNIVFFDSPSQIRINSLSKNIDSLNLITVGSLIEVKNFSFLIAVAHKLKLLNINFKLLIIGDGELHQKLSLEINRLNLNHNIFLMGYLNRDRIFELLTESHIFLSSSHHETFGVSIIEALSVGIPVIALSGSGPDDILNSKCGKLVSTGNIDSYVEAIIDIKENYINYNPDIIIKECFDKFSPQTISNKLISIYNEFK